MSQLSEAKNYILKNTFGKSITGAMGYDDKIVLNFQGGDSLEIFTPTATIKVPTPLFCTYYTPPKQEPSKC